jgi:glucan biosynthesis protein C
MDDRGVTRVYFIDWLRILAVLLLLPFHTLRVFDEADPFYVKASPVSVWVGEVLRSNSGYTGSYWHYLVSGDFMRMNIQDGGDYFGGFGIGQLWFIMFLLFISLIAMPPIVWGARGRGVGRMQASCRRLAHPAWWLLAIVILFVGGLAPDIPGGPFVFYLFVFVLGFIAVCDPKFMESAERYRIPALAVGVGLTLFWVLSTNYRESFPDPSWQLAGLEFGGTIATWLMLMGMLGFGKRYLERTSRAQKYLAESSYPVYILHQTVIVIIGFYLVRLAAPRPVLWVLLLVAAVAGTFALYEIVRRVGPLRFLFGMRQRRRAPRAVEPTPSRIETKQVDV